MAVFWILTACEIIIVDVSEESAATILGRVNSLHLVAKVTDGGSLSIK